VWQLLVDFKKRSTAFKFTTNNATEMLASWERRVLKDWSDWLCLTCGKKESDPQSPAPFDGLSKDLRSCDVFFFWKTIHSGFSKLRSRMMWFRHQNLQASLLGDLFLQEIIKFFKMMKTYHDEAPGVPVRHWQSWQGFKLSAVQDGDLCAVKIGQLSWDPAAKDVNQAELE